MNEAKQIAVACLDDGGMGAEVSGHFGRCPYFALVSVSAVDDVDTRVVLNPHYPAHQPGVIPGFIRELGADVIIAGGMGPKAVGLFEQMGITVATGAAGDVRSAISAYLSGRLRGVVPCGHDHPESCGGHG